VCVSCNIAISVRVASPGDSGGVTQTTGTNATSIATGVAAAAQAAAQALPEAAPQQPAVPPPAPPQPAAPIPPAVSGVPSARGTPAVLAVPAAALAVPVDGPEADDAPRHGAPDFGPGKAPRASAVHVHALFHKTTASAVSVVLIRTVRVTTARSKNPHHAVRRQHGAGARAPRPFPPAPSRTPAPLAVAPALTETHDTGGFTTFALGAGALGAFLLVLLGYLAPGLQTVRSQPGRAHPDPPG
jgi:hypothetical protein